MASIVRNESRGTWQVQWNDGREWRRVTVVRKRRGWKPGDPMPKKPPAEATDALASYLRREQAARLNRAPASELTVGEFLACYLAVYEASRKPPSVTALDRAVRRFLEFCEGAKVERVDQVTPDVADRFLTWRSKDVGYHAVATQAALLAGAWGRAVKLRQLQDNPWKGLTIPGKRPPDRKSSWTREEFTRLQAVASPRLADLLALGCLTGLRVSALTGLEWRDVKWSESDGSGYGEVRVRPELDKAGKGYSVPMSRECHDLLFRLNATHPGDHNFVLTKTHGGRVASINSTARQIVRACRLAGLPRPDAPCHAMRRTFGRWCVVGDMTGRPVPLYVVSRWMGHASVTMTERYLDLHERTSHAWMASEPAPAEGQPPAG